MHHAQKTVVRQFHQRKAKKTVTKQDGNLGGENRHGNVDEQSERCRSRQQAKNHHQSANGFDRADKRAKKIGMRQSDIRKTSCAERVRFKKFENAFIEKHATDRKSTRLNSSHL